VIILNPYFKPNSCSIRRTPPIGPLAICENYCQIILRCITITKTEIETGIPVKPIGKRNEVKKPEPRSRFCKECDKPIARASTVEWSFKGMFVIHLKHKHPKIFKKYKAGEIEYQDLFYIKNLKQD